MRAVCYEDIKKNNFCQQRKEFIKGNLHQAVSSNNLKDVQSLLQNGANVNKENVHGDTPLSIALREVSENVELIKELLNYGASLTRMKKYSEDPLHLAIRNQKSLKVIQELIKYGANVNAKNGLGVEPIFIALFKSEVNVQIVKELLKNGASVTTRDFKGNSQLHLVIRQNRSLEIVREILNYGDVNSRDKYGFTPIAAALEMAEENDSVIEELLKHGVSVNQTNDYGDTLLHIACKTPKSLNVVQEILNYQPDVNKKNDCGETPLFKAVRSNAILEVIRELIKHGASTFHRDKNGQTILHYAVTNFNIIQELLNCGIDVNIKNSLNRTPIMYAFNNPDVLKELLKYGASVHETDEKGFTPLHYAVKKNANIDIIMDILNHGADVSVESFSGFSPFFMALESKRCDLKIFEEIIGEFVKHGASFTKSNSSGDTPLHIVLRSRKSLKLIREILKHETDVNRPNEHGETPIFDACRANIKHWFERIEVIKELLKYGASVLVKNKKNQTPLQFAVRMVEYPIIQELLKHGADVHNKDVYGKTPLSVFENSALIPRCAIELINYGASVHESFKIDTLLILKGRNELFVDVLIKYALIEHLDSIHCVYCDELKLKFPRNVQFYKKEIEKMKSECIVNELTLYDCVIQKCDYGKVFSIQNDILEKRKFEQIQINIPIYSGVIFIRLETRKYLLRHLYDTPTFIKINDKIIHLNPCCLQIIARYLSKNDLKNLIAAFSEQFFSFFSTSSISFECDQHIFGRIPTYYMAQRYKICLINSVSLF